MVKIAIFDFDGTFTNGNVTFKNNCIIKKYNVKDGLGIKLLKNKNIKTCVLTGFKHNNSFIEICTSSN